MGIYGDNSTTYMRGGSLSGFRIEAGCWTQGTDSTIYIPTTFVECIALVCGSEGPNAVPDVSSGHITAPGSGASTSGKVINYIAAGW